MLACEIASAVCELRRRWRGIQLEPDEEHEEDDADLRDHPEERAPPSAAAGSA